MLTPEAVANAIRQIHAQIEAIRDELNAADRALGDGDTGMTIAAVVAAWQDALATPYPGIATMLQQLARATRRTTGSSLGSVLAIGIGAAAKEAPAATEAGRDALIRMLAAAANAIAERSGAAVGDKTILDSVVAVRTALVDAPSGTGLAQAALEGAASALEEFRSREARVGRARIYGSKSVGLDDPGMRAALLLLRAAARADGPDACSRCRGAAVAGAAAGPRSA
jgi:dihydroxyacetone kinase